MNPFEFAFPVGLSTAVTFGGAGVYGLRKISGLDPTDTREDINDKSEADGSFVFARYRDYRRMIFDGDLHQSADNPSLFQAALDALERAFAPQVTEQRLDFMRIDGSVRTIWCRPTRFHYDVDTMFSLQYAEWHLELIAESPAVYGQGGGAPGGGGGGGVGGKTLLLTLGTSTPANGLDFGGAGQGANFGGAGGGLDFGGGGGGSQATGTASNDGTASSAPTARITGPITNPVMRNLTTGESLGFIITLATGDYLDIDFGLKTVVLNGTANRYNTIDPAASTFWKVQPGANTILFGGSAGSAQTTALLSWSDAF